MNIYHNADISSYSYIKIGGIVKNLIIAENEKDLINAYIYDNNALVFGNTSKTLFAFDYLDKTVILDKNNYIIDLKQSVLIGSGTPLAKIGWYFEEKNLDGFSKIRTIPGLLGGSLTQNASCFLQCISEYIETITIIKEHKVITLKKEDVWFSYRNSYFKKNKCVILHCTFKKVYKNKKNLRDEYLKTLLMRDRQPKKEINLGSIFQNKNGYSVSKILDSLSLRGFHKTNNVEISKKHANFLNIKKECKYEEILLLINTLFIVLYKRTKIIFPMEIIIIRGGGNDERTR